MNLQDFITNIRNFTGFKDPAVQTDDFIRTWISFAEERLNRELRVREMIVARFQVDLTTADQALPTDFLEMDYLYHPTYKSIRWLSRDEFYDNSSPAGYYTVSGMTISVGGTGFPLSLKADYFGRIPPLGSGSDTPLTDSNWVSELYPRLYTASTMSVALMSMQEDDRAMEWEAETASTISKLNEMYLKSVASGSRITRNVKSFG